MTATCNASKIDLQNEEVGEKFSSRGFIWKFGPLKIQIDVYSELNNKNKEIYSGHILEEVNIGMNNCICKKQTYYQWHNYPTESTDFQYKE